MLFRFRMLCYLSACHAPYRYSGIAKCVPGSISLSGARQNRPNDRRPGSFGNRFVRSPETELPRDFTISDEVLSSSTVQEVATDPMLSDSLFGAGFVVPGYTKPGAAAFRR